MSYSKHASQARIFVTVRPDLVEAGSQRNKNKQTNNMRKKSDKTIRHLILYTVWMGCLIRFEHVEGLLEIHKMQYAKC